MKVPLSFCFLENQSYAEYHKDITTPPPQFHIKDKHEYNKSIKCGAEYRYAE